MPVTKVNLSSQEFGETYHIGAAMVLTPNSNQCKDYLISYDSNSDKPMTNAQLTFLDTIRNSPSYPQNITGTLVETLAKSKCTEDIIAPAFANSPSAAVSKVISCFLSECLNNYQGEVANSASRKMYLDLNAFIKTLNNSFKYQSTRAIIRIRNKGDQDRNMTPELLTQIATSLSTIAKTKEIILVGDTMNLPTPPSGISYIDLRSFLTNSTFTTISGSGLAKGNDFSFVAQLMFYHILHTNFHVKMQIGMMSGAMDGTAFVGVPTIFFEEQSGAAPAANSRMGQAAVSIPWMEQVSYVNGSFNSKIKKSNKMPTATIITLDSAIVNLNKL